MSILEDFYTEKIHPMDIKPTHNSKHNLYAVSYEEIYTHLKENLSEKNQKLLNDMFECGLDLSYENGKENYISGFITGMQFAAECFCKKN